MHKTIEKTKIELEPLIGIINDFESFFDKIDKRREQLEELKDEILIYSDPEFMESLKRAGEDAKAGRVKKFKDRQEFDEYFKKLSE